jgi:hypothetical protein
VSRLTDLTAVKKAEAMLASIEASTGAAVAKSSGPVDPVARVNAMLDEIEASADPDAVAKRPRGRQCEVDGRARGCENNGPWRCVRRRMEAGSSRMSPRARSRRAFRDSVTWQTWPGQSTGSSSSKSGWVGSRPSSTAPWKSSSV